MPEQSAEKSKAEPQPDVAVRTFREVPRRMPLPRMGELAGLLQVAAASGQSLRLRTRDGVHLMLAASGFGALAVWWMMTIRWAAVLFRIAPRATGTLFEAVILWLLFGGWGLFGLLMLSQGGRRVTVDRDGRTFRSRWAWGLRGRTWGFEQIPRVTLILGPARRRGARFLSLSIRDDHSRRVLELGPINANEAESTPLVRVAAQIARIVGCPLLVEGWGDDETAPVALADLEGSPSPKSAGRR